MESVLMAGNLAHALSHKLIQQVAHLTQDLFVTIISFGHENRSQFQFKFETTTFAKG